uniref:VPS37D subunit of ESCRT-I n=1 Tax=Amazona collaria TaxID=241587 RepID=A0A8B9J183_9PSIT
MWSCWRESRGGHGDAARAGAALLWSQAERAGLGTAQLRALLQDEPRLQRAARLSRKFQSLQLEREMCLASNCSQAKVNLSLRPQLEDGKAALAIKYQELQEIREACWDKQRRLGEWSALSWLHAPQAQVEQFLAQDLPLDSFLESFCQSRTRSHICRTQLEKLQELLQDWVGRDPEGPTGCRGALPSLAPARLAVVPFAMPTGPPRHHLPALEHQPASPCSKIPSLGSPLHLVGHVPLLSPQPSCRQQEHLPPHC